MLVDAVPPLGDGRWAIPLCSSWAHLRMRNPSSFAYAVVSVTL